MTAARALAEELQAIGGIVARARAELEADGIIELSPLEARIEDLCARIERLSVEDGRKLHPRLLALIDDFGHLGGALEKRMDELKSKLGDTAGRRRAVSAYGKSSGPTG